MALAFRFLVNFVVEIKPRECAQEILTSQFKLGVALARIETLKNLMKI